MGLPPRWRLQEIVGRAPVSRTAPVVIGGCGSSGTTLLRRMLDRHGAICCGPESTVFLSRISSPQELAGRFGFAPAEIAAWKRTSRSRTEFIERFQAACLARSGKRIWADKTPENLRCFHAIRRLFPEARFVHVIRDGRDVACSLRRARWMPLEKMTGGADRNSPEAFEACLRYWAERVRFGRGLAGDPRYCEIRYEDLVHDPEGAMRRLLDFLGLEWDPAVLHSAEAAAEPSAGPLFSSSVGRWRHELTAAEADLANRHAGELLAELGYAKDGAWAARLPPSRDPDEAPAAVPDPPPAGSPLKRLRREAVALWFALRDRRCPKLAWALGVAAAAYLALPFDLIPDRIPVFGYLDDAVAVLLVAGLVRLIIPRDLLSEQRRLAALRTSRRIWSIGGRQARA